MQTPDLNGALTDLRSADKHVRARAVACLIQVGTSAIPPLLELLNDSDWVIRYRAAEALGGIGDIRTIDHLIARTMDENDHVRYMATKSLAKMQDPRIVPVLMKMLTDEHTYTRRIAAEGLRALGSENATLTLQEPREEQSDPDVQKSA